jgi:hypothetical protein
MVGGFLFDQVGFPRATLIYAGVLVLVAAAIWIFLGGRHLAAKRSAGATEERVDNVTDADGKVATVVATTKGGGGNTNEMV